NRLTSYRVHANGRPDAPMVNASSGITPFGFAFNRDNVLLVSEAFGGAAGASAMSSYRLEGASTVVVSPSVGTTQTAACWVAVTPDGRYAYTTNAGSGSVSSYRVMTSGVIELLAAVAGNDGAGSGPIDAAIPPGGGALHVLNGGTHTISSYAIGGDGSLAPQGTAMGLPTSAAGLAAN
ncbi:MAG TPA: beta-propeller fold lactonase family protein, partial [Albitalea sp.]